MKCANRFHRTPPLTRSTLDTLRAETSTVHYRLDQTFGLIDRLHAVETRAALVKRYLAFHKGAETAVSPYFSAIAGLDFPARCRSSLIERDIQALGETAPMDCGPQLDIGTRNEAFGALYVLEGSSLGGRSILKELVRRKVVPTGLGFLNPYGNLTAEFWFKFLAILERETAFRKRKISEAVSGAIKTFAFAESCLSKESSN